MRNNKKLINLFVIMCVSSNGDEKPNKKKKHLKTLLMNE